MDVASVLDQSVFRRMDVKQGGSYSDLHLVGSNAFCPIVPVANIPCTDEVSLDIISVYEKRASNVKAAKKIIRYLSIGFGSLQRLVTYSPGVSIM